MPSSRPMEVPDLLQHQVIILRLPLHSPHCYFYTILMYGHGSHWLYLIQVFRKLGLLWAFSGSPCLGWSTSCIIWNKKEMLAGPSPGNLASLQLFSQSVSGLQPSQRCTFCCICIPHCLLPQCKFPPEEPDTTVSLTFLLHLMRFLSATGKFWQSNLGYRRE